MGKDHWNRKRVYSIRKFSIGVCSIVIGTYFLLFGASVAGATPVYAEETRVLVAAEKPVEEKPVEEEVTADEVDVEVDDMEESIDDVIAECTGSVDEAKEPTKDAEEPWYVARAKRMGDYYNW